MMPYDALSGFEEAPTIAIVVASVSSCVSAESGGMAWALRHVYSAARMRTPASVARAVLALESGLRRESRRPASAADVVDDGRNRDDECLDGELAPRRLRQQPQNDRDGEQRHDRSAGCNERRAAHSHIASPELPR